MGVFGTIRFLALLVLLTYVLNVAVLASDEDFRDVGGAIVSYLGVEFWLSGFGVVIAAVGTSTELSALRRWKRQAEDSGGWA